MRVCASSEVLSVHFLQSVWCSPYRSFRELAALSVTMGDKMSTKIKNCSSNFQDQEMTWNRKLKNVSSDLASGNSGGHRTNRICSLLFCLASDGMRCCSETVRARASRGPNCEAQAVEVSIKHAGNDIFWRVSSGVHDHVVDDLTVDSAVLDLVLDDIKVGSGVSDLLEGKLQRRLVIQDEPQNNAYEATMQLLHWSSAQSQWLCCTCVVGTPLPLSSIAEKVCRERDLTWLLVLQRRHWSPRSKHMMDELKKSRGDESAMHAGCKTVHLAVTTHKQT